MGWVSPYREIIIAEQMGNALERAEQRIAELEEGRDALREALHLDSKLLEQLRGFANDVLDGPSKVTETIDLALEQTRALLEKED